MNPLSSERPVPDVGTRVAALTLMSDDKNKRGRQDRNRISLSEEYEVRYWTEQLGVSRKELEEAVKSVGNSAKKVRGHFSSRKQSSRKQSSGKQSSGKQSSGK